jgi:hypothetical protein
MTRQNEARLLEPGDRPTRAVAMLPRPDNRLTRLIARFDAVPASIRPYLLSKMFGWKVPFVGTAGIAFDELVPGRARLTLSNRRRVRNHLGGVHAAAMTLLAEAASGFVLGLSLPARGEVLVPVRIIPTLAMTDPRLPIRGWRWT